tara:strand:- start:395 stop:571 length:177 start_codon:yes stop_codon:yes gene_type:complete
MQLIIQYLFNHTQLLLAVVVLHRLMIQYQDSKAQVVFLDLDHYHLLVVEEEDLQECLV